MKRIISLALALVLIACTSSHAWLVDYRYRITVSSESDVVDSTLSDFPVTIILSSSSGISNDDVTTLFAIMQSDANRKKIAFTDSADAQCYVEIESWDTANEIAVLHAKITSLSHSADGTYYLYFDPDAAENTSYVGDMGSEVAQNVWDSNYKLVCHMDYADGWIDSTGTYTLSGGSGDNEVDGPVGKAYDGTTGITAASVAMQSAYTIEYIWNPDLAYDYDGFQYLYRSDLQDGTYLGIYKRPAHADPNFNFVYGVTYDDPFFGTTYHHLDGATYWKQNETHYTAATMSVEYPCTDEVQHYYDGAAVSSFFVACHSHLPSSGTADLRIGHAFDGTMDEVRLSNKRRSAAWIKATYNSLWDTLFEYGSFESAPYTMSRMVHPNYSDSYKQSLRPVGVKLATDNAGPYAVTPNFGPQAIYLASENKDIVVYRKVIAGTVYAYAFYYDRSTGRFSPHYQIGASAIDPADQHDSPAIGQDRDGYFHVLFGAHHTSFQHYKSDSPLDITSWTNQGDTSFKGTYPHMLYNPDDQTLYVVYRGTTSGGLNGCPHPSITRVCMSRYTTSWQAEQTLVDISDCTEDMDYPTKYVYPLPGLILHDGKIHFGFELNQQKCSEFIHYYSHLVRLYYDPSDSRVHDLDGTDLGVTATWTECLSSKGLALTEQGRTFDNGVIADGRLYCPVLRIVDGYDSSRTLSWIDDTWSELYVYDFATDAWSVEEIYPLHTFPHTTECFLNDDGDLVIYNSYTSRYKIKHISGDGSFSPTVYSVPISISPNRAAPVFVKKIEGGSDKFPALLEGRTFTEGVEDATHRLYMQTYMPSVQSYHYYNGTAFSQGTTSGVTVDGDCLVLERGSSLGYWESPEIDISHLKMHYYNNISLIRDGEEWHDLIYVTTNLSLDGGTTWEGWEYADMDGIKGLTNGTDITNVRLKVRVYLSTTEATHYHHPRLDAIFIDFYPNYYTTTVTSRKLPLVLETARRILEGMGQIIPVTITY